MPVITHKNVRPLISYLYDEKTCQTVRELWDEDTQAVKQAIGCRLLEKSDTLIPCDNIRLIDIILLTCLNSPFANSEDECATVAVLLAQQLRCAQPLPRVTEDRGLTFAGKALVSLSFFYSAMERRWQRHGAPSPDYYRRVSAMELRRADHDSVAEHHAKWEAFLGEVFV